MSLRPTASFLLWICSHNDKAPLAFAILKFETELAERVEAINGLLYFTQADLKRCLQHVDIEHSFPQFFLPRCKAIVKTKNG